MQVSPTRAFLYGFLISFTISIFVNSCSQLQAHSWYDMECCHERDCAPVVEMKEFPEGTLMSTEHGTALVPHNLPLAKRKASRDEKYHLCQRRDPQKAKVDPSGATVYCVYYPLNF